MYDPQVHIHKTVLMQRLLDAVSRSYCWYTSGTIVRHKAQHLAEKFAGRYGVHLNENQRAYARRNGEANARLFLLTQPACTDLCWWLLASKGVGAVHEQEQPRHALDPRRRIRIADDYELVRRTRPSVRGGGTVWTWRMTHACYGQWRDRIIMACRRAEPFEITRVIGSLHRSPGFSGIREQVGKLTALARKEWRRRHGSLDGLTLPPKLPYVERLTDTSMALSVLN